MRRHRKAYATQSYLFDDDEGLDAEYVASARRSAAGSPARSRASSATPPRLEREPSLELVAADNPEGAGAAGADARPASLAGSHHGQSWRVASEAWNEARPPSTEEGSPKPRSRFLAKSVRKLLKSGTKTRTFRTTWQASAVKLVRSARFEYSVCLLIILNALMIGAQTNYSATGEVEGEALGFAVVELLFGGIFFAELMLRLFAFRSRFFHMTGWEWNVFDTLVVVVHLADTILSGLPNFSFVRLLRLMRLVRSIRVIRILRHITELKTLVISIGNSLASLGWTLVLLSMLIYTMSLCITQVVLDHRLSNPAEDGDGLFDELRGHYGSVPRTMMSLFQAVSGGQDWDVLVSPLSEQISWLLSPIFCLYVAFMMLALMNVVTALFIESVLESAKKEKDLFFSNNVRELFRGVDGGINSGELDWPTFEDRMHTRPMREFFKAVDIDPSEASELFNLLDLDQGGSVNAEEFLNGCLRLRGPAKALDLALLIREVGKIQQMLERAT